MAPQAGATLDMRPHLPGSRADPCLRRKQQTPGSPGGCGESLKGGEDYMASGPITSWEIDGETVETVSDFILGGSKITADGDCTMNLKDTCSLEGKL